ncbi:MAG: T9SS type A sorting domain-containing protein [Bacteroidia bacterium]
MKLLIKCLIFSLLLLGSFLGIAQDHQLCNSQEFRVDVYSEVDILKDVKYGEAKTIAGVTQELKMDIYSPKTQSIENRPVVVLAFGGSFISGNKSSLALLATAFARKGYVAVSIDYRIYDLPLNPLPTSLEMQDVVAKAIKDMKTAVKFLHDDAVSGNTYGIDEDWIFVGGVSAGSIVASHVAMLDSSEVVAGTLKNAFDNNAPIDGITNTDSSIHIRGLLNYSGALFSADIIDSNDPPLVSFHDDGDGTVPYGGRDISLLGSKILYVDGSYVMDSVARLKGLKSELNTFVNSNDHMSYFKNAQKMNEVIEQSSMFMFSELCSETAAISTFQSEESFGVYPNPFTSTITFSSLPGFNNEIVVRNAIGQEVYTTECSDRDVCVLNLEELQSGIYIVEVSGEDRLQKTKIVKE